MKKIDLILTCFFSLLGLFLCEAAARIVAPDLKFSYNRQYHQEFGWVHQSIPNLYNLAGYRDVDHDLVKETGIKRLLVLGDSFSAAPQVELDETYWRRLSVMLNEQSPGGWEVLNFGVGGFGTTQEYLTLVEQGLLYEPDVILLQVFPLNDICDNALDAAFFVGPQDYYRPYLSTKDDCEKVTYVYPGRAWLRRYSYLFRFIEPYGTQFLSRIRNVPAPGTDEHMLLHGFKIVESKNYFGVSDLSTLERAHILLNTFARPEEQLDVVKQGWAVTEQVIQRIINIGKVNDISVILLVMPHDSQLEPRYSTFSEKMPYAFDPHYADKRLINLVASSKVPVVSLIDQFSAQPDIVLPYIGGHLNKEAHLVVARRVLETMNDIAAVRE